MIDFRLSVEVDICLSSWSVYVRDHEDPRSEDVTWRKSCAHCAWSAGPPLQIATEADTNSNGDCRIGSDPGQKPTRTFPVTHASQDLC